MGVAIQYIHAEWDGWGYQSQLPAGVRGFTIDQHAGMYADLTLIPFIIAYSNDRFSLPWVSWLSLICLAIAAVGWFVLLQQFRKAGITMPEAHTHNGKTTVAGWIHYVFAVIATWDIFLLVLGVHGKDVTLQDVIVLGIALTIFFPLGQWKFSSLWDWKHDLNKPQIACLWIITWVILVGKHEQWSWFMSVESFVQKHLA